MTIKSNTTAGLTKNNDILMSGPSLITQMKSVVCGVINDEQKSNEIVYALIRNFGGERLYIPSNDYEKRNKEIKELHKAGANVEQLSSRYRVSIKTVYRIIEN